MATETTAASACVKADGSALGMPQLCADWFGNQIFWLVITLVVVYFLMAKVALPRIAAVIAERHGAIQGDLDQAEMLKQKAVDAEEAYKKALAEARTEANAIVAETRAEIAKELEAATAKADAEIAAKSAESEKAIAEIRDNAAAAVKDVAKDTAAAIVAKVMPSVDTTSVASVVDSRLKG